MLAAHSAAACLAEAGAAAGKRGRNLNDAEVRGRTVGTDWQENLQGAPSTLDTIIPLNQERSCKVKQLLKQTMFMENCYTLQLISDDANTIAPLANKLSFCSLVYV